MRKIVPSLIFVSAYVLSVLVVCIIWRDALLADAVVSLWVPFIFSLVTFAVAGAAGVIAVSITGLRERRRILLAVVYALIIGVALHGWFVFSSDDRQHEFLDALGVPLLIFVNVVLAGGFLFSAHALANEPMSG